ncbi:hypothetical protein DV092_04240 [Clostridium botulinum]|uniref:hypothetical protein n=1 Tax=Clostridium sp. ZBS20 TaxID=2949966 RepID=UPI00207A6ACF|nr:hypothetical protein [Clostridium sp. ZBS20]MBN1051266.1 hypothetical protein [Clostridium botulinum]
MKILVVHNEKGQIIFTQTNAIEQYGYLVDEVADNKEVIGVDLETNKFILADRLATTEELEKKNKELEIKSQKLENKELESIKLTDKVIELTAKNLINQ